MLEIIVLFIIHLFSAALGLCGCVPAFSSCAEWGLLSRCGAQALIAVASLVAEQGF